MLNLPIVMFNHLLIFLVLFLNQTADVSIVSPLSGETLRGKVNIVGNMDVPNFASAELAFSYASTSTDSFAWFTIQTFSQPVHEERSTLAVWDTTTITDGDYILHLRVFLQDGTSQDVMISGLKIRNDIPLPTDMPTATETPDSITINPLSTSSLVAISTIQPVTALPTFPSPTPLPANPASVTSASIYSIFARGALLTLVLFAFFSLILRLRKN
jgi:hypothetical protein